VIVVALCLAFALALGAQRQHVVVDSQRDVLRPHARHLGGDLDLAIVFTDVNARGDHGAGGRFARRSAADRAVKYQADYPATRDPLLPIDVRRVAERLRCSPELLFGRLHYDMGARLRHRNPCDANLTEASIFEVKAGDEMHCVNFPYLSSHLANLEHEEHRASRTF